MSDPSQQSERPPIVAVLGHVDHGKSTLLDYIRKTNTVAKEAGGITQHVAAYEVERVKNGETKRITFIDTPGHAAFKTIRARGANVADIAILVVAADDGVKAQTLEALESIRSAKTPFIVAINKIDKPNADLNRTQATLMEQNVFLEKLGGDIPWAAISAKTGQGVDELLDLILLVAEMQEHIGNTTKPAHGFCIEAHRDKRRGIAATLIITDGTLKSGMTVTVGNAIAPVRIMENHAGGTLRSATFSTPVQLIGFNNLPDVGLEFQSFKNKKEAEAACEAYALAHKAAASAAFETVADQHVLPIIVRADTSGSLEALASEIAKLGNDTMRVHIVQSGIGAITENDIKAAGSGSPRATVIGFNTNADSIAQALALRDSIKIEQFNIIYKLTERLEAILKETAPSRDVETIIGRARILKRFSSRRDEHVIGARVIDGELRRGASARVMRRNVAVGIGKIRNLQANRQDVQKVEKEGEFGAMFDSNFEPAEGDIMECIVITTT